MSPWKKTADKSMRGNVSTADIMNSASSPEKRSDMRRGTTLAAVLADLQAVVDKLGHFPSRLEYKEHGRLFHTMIVRIHGLQNLAKQLGMSGPPPGMKKRVRPRPYTCFNGELCVNHPPTKVSDKQTYCRACKVVRGWYGFREEYNG